LDVKSRKKGDIISMNESHFNELDLESLSTINGGKYYGNGVYCGKKTCQVDWGQAWGSIAGNMVAGWAGAGGTNYPTHA